MNRLLRRLWLAVFYFHRGSDAYGNDYYESKKVLQDGRRTREVVIRGYVEATKIPVMWRAWLLHQISEAPVTVERRHRWEAPSIPNMTGTVYAYHPGVFGRSAVIFQGYQKWNRE